MKLSRNGDLTTEVMAYTLGFMHEGLKGLTEEEEEPYFRAVVSMLVYLRDEHKHLDGKDILGIEPIIEKKVLKVIGKIDVAQGRHLKLVSSTDEENEESDKGRETKPAPSARGLLDSYISCPKIPTKIHTWVK